jgi:hypothetical protein
VAFLVEVKAKLATFAEQFSVKSRVSQTEIPS